MPYANANRAEREPVEVTIEIDGTEVVAGTLWVHERRSQSATFRYAEPYLEHPFAYEIDPALPLSTAVAQTPPDREMFGVFTDGSPDRWGQNLMRRGERDRAKVAGAVPRSLTGSDFLLGTRDDIRQGAVRFRRPGTDDYWSTAPHGVPKIVKLGALLNATDHFVTGEDGDLDIQDLLDAGSSLGGARPKAAVVYPDDRLAIAKFPRKGSDEWDVIGWEKLEADLAAAAGVIMAPTELTKISGRNVLLTERFDRSEGHRVGFASALTMLEAKDSDKRSYLEIAELIERHSTNAAAELTQLYRRIIFSVLTSNTDDHLRNHGFLRGKTGWSLAPAFDLNPNPEQRGRLATSIDLDDFAADLELAVSVAGYFRLTDQQALTIVAEVETATRDWRAHAKDLGLTGQEIDLMEQAFETDQRVLARRIAF